MLKFKLWLEQEDPQQPIVFVDFDETLVSTRKLGDAISNWAQEKEKVPNDFFFKNPEQFGIYQKKMFDDLKKLNPIVIGDSSQPFKAYVSLLRPHAIDFIRNLKPFRVCVLSQGKKNLQQEIVNKQNIPVDAVYGREDIQSNAVPTSNMCVLIDNLSPNDTDIQQKLFAMGITKLPDPEFKEEVDKNRMYDHFVQIKSWFGDPNDSELPTKVSEIKDKMANLMAVGV